MAGSVQSVVRTTVSIPSGTDLIDIMALLGQVAAGAELYSATDTGSTITLTFTRPA